MKIHNLLNSAEILSPNKKAARSAEFKQDKHDSKMPYL